MDATVKSPESTAPLPVTAQALTVIPLPRRRRPDLATVRDVRREAAKVYREVRLGKIDSQEGSRLTYMLTSVGKLIEAAEVQERVEALEYALRGRSK